VKAYSQRLEPDSCHAHQHKTESLTPDSRQPQTAPDPQHMRHHIIIYISCYHGWHGQNLISISLIAWTAYSYRKAWRILAIILGVERHIGAGVTQYSFWVQTERPGHRGSIPGRNKSTFPLATVSRPALKPTQAPVQRYGFVSPGLKRGRGVTLITHPHLVPSIRMSRSYTSSLPIASMACSGGALALDMYIKLRHTCTTKDLSYADDE
jgi:hypothetical protein